MLTYREKLINDIMKMPEEQAKKFYLIFQTIKQEFDLSRKPESDWKKDFRNISVWEDDNFDEIRERFNQWQGNKKY